MSRIKKLPIDQWDPELRAMTSADSVTGLEQGMMRMLAHCPEIAKGFARFAGALKLNRSLSDRLSEIVRLRISYHNQCRSCMAIRYKDAMADGNQRLKKGEAPNLNIAVTVQAESGGASPKVEKNFQVQCWLNSSARIPVQPSSPFGQTKRVSSL